MKLKNGWKPYREYPQIYEKIFYKQWYSRTSRKSVVDLRKVAVAGDFPKGRNEYIETVRKNHLDAEQYMYQFLVRSLWLELRFKYNGRRRTGVRRNGLYYERVYAQFIRNTVNIERRLFSRTGLYWAGPIHSYFGDLYPRFLEDNPFEDPYPFPYRNISIGHLIVVYQLREHRLLMLQNAENKNMPYGKFLDWALNWSLCENEYIGENRYRFQSNSSRDLPYIKDTKYSKRGKQQASGLKFNYDKKSYYEGKARRLRGRKNPKACAERFSAEALDEGPVGGDN